MKALVFVAVGYLASGCGGKCLDLPEECTSQYDASTFNAVYANTISGCAHSTCHGGSTGQGELALGTTADEAYEAIRAFVTPGDAVCSELMDHLDPSGLGDMPPGQPLSEVELCSVRQWIDEGARR